MESIITANSILPEFAVFCSAPLVDLDKKTDDRILLQEVIESQFFKSKLGIPHSLPPTKYQRPHQLFSWLGDCESCIARIPECIRRIQDIARSVELGKIDAR